jgi:hypothetical protein
MITLPDGTQVRFCQQCHKFHPLSAYRREQRSCEATLAAHCAKRRQVMEGTRVGAEGAAVTAEAAAVPTGGDQPAQPAPAPVPFEAGAMAAAAVAAAQPRAPYTAQAFGLWESGLHPGPMSWVVQARSTSSAARAADALATMPPPRPPPPPPQAAAPVATAAVATSALPPPPPLQVLLGDLQRTLVFLRGTLTREQSEFR